MMMCIDRRGRSRKHIRIRLPVWGRWQCISRNDSTLMRRSCNLPFPAGLCQFCHYCNPCPDIFALVAAVILFDFPHTIDTNSAINVFSTRYAILLFSHASAFPNAQMDDDEPPWHSVLPFFFRYTPSLPRRYPLTCFGIMPNCCAITDDENSVCVCSSAETARSIRSISVRRVIPYAPCQVLCVGDVIHTSL